MPAIAVVAHSGKSLGGGLTELREVLAREGVADPLWYEVAKSRQAPKRAHHALAQGAELIFVWGGDGTVQRCIDAVAGTDAVLAILPAGTANLLAANLDIPADLTEAVRIGLKGERRRLDTGSVNGERFAVMAGAGFDARMIKEAGRGRKGRFGRAAQGRAGQSPFIAVTRGKQFRIRLGRSWPYELDGSARTEVKKMRVKVHPGSVTICVPEGR